MLIILYALWFILNGRVTLEIALIGLPVCALLYWFTCKFLGNSPRLEGKLFRKSGKAIRYLARLFCDIVRANVSVMKLILSPRYVAEPEITTFTPALKTQTARVILADSITLTPGTITVDMKDGELTVHALDKGMADVQNSKEEQALRELEA